MKLFKKVLIIFSGLLGILLLLLIISGGVLFYKPTLLLNPKNIQAVLNKTKFFEKWSWSEANINHKWLKWNERHLQGNVKDFCFLLKKPYTEIDACIDDSSWDFIIRYEFKKGFSFVYKNPLQINSRTFKVATREDPSKKDNKPPNIMAIWNMLWKSYIPDIYVNFQQIVISNLDNREKKPFELKIEAQKIKNNLQASSFGFNMNATPERIVLTGPEELRLPFKIKTRIPLSFKEIKVVAEIKKKEIPISAEAKIATAVFNVNSLISKDSLEKDLGKPVFLQKIISVTSGELVIDKVKETIKLVMRPPYNILPAPFNALEGKLNIKMKGESSHGNDGKVNLSSELNMRSKTQAVHFILDSKIPFALDKKEIKGVDAELIIKRIALQLPQLARNRIPPQMLPDKRFKDPEKEMEKKKKRKRAIASAKNKAPKEVEIKLQALGNESFNLKTNLLDEMLRLNFDLMINELGIRTGFLSALPLRTTFFKRPIILNLLKITFNQPIIPQIVVQVVFDLPEYKITLDIEGPINQPRHAFKSVPPLPLDDIYSVLLFGQPLSSLDDSDKESAQKTSELVSKGILNLAVLYYFAGTPVESIGYDPDTDVVTAQVGLGDKSSLHLSGEEGGLNSAGVRRSLGKGWYIDSSVQKSSGVNNDFGVLLERIISY